jgi:hypothetical protein
VIRAPPLVLSGRWTLARQACGLSSAQVSLISLWSSTWLTRLIHLLVDQVRYNFYVPPVLFDGQNAPQTGSFPTPSKPVTPFPGVVKYLPPDRASEAPKGHGTRHMLAKPTPQTSKLLTLYGENFSKTDPVSVFIGSEPSQFVEVRCSEVMGCLPPENHPTKRRPVILVRGDGVVFPSPVMYP